MFQLLRPFLSLLSRGKFSMSGWSILRTLILLAMFRRMYPWKKDISVRLGSYTIYGPDYGTLSALIKEKFVDQEYLIENIETIPVIVDGGSNIGISVIYFKSLFPDAVIHCFEPLSEAFQYLQKNVTANNLSNIVLHQKALTNYNGEGNFTVPSAENIINGRLSDTAAKESSRKVETVKLSAFLRALQPVDLIKLDVEGAEANIVAELAEAGVLNKAMIKNMVIEFHQSLFQNDQQLNNTVKRFESGSYHVSTRQLYSDVLLTIT